MSKVLSQSPDIGGRKRISDLGLGIEQVAKRILQIYWKALGGKEQFGQGSPDRLPRKGR
jgi:hypothetical protein